MVLEKKMPVPAGYYGQQQGPSCLDKMKMGFMLGFCVGMASGALFGGFSALRYVEWVNWCVGCVSCVYGVEDDFGVKS